MGIVFAFLALFSWGVGDFLIQKCIHRFGKIISLFFISLIGVIMTFPFVFNDFGSLFTDSKSLLVLSLAGIVILLAALFNFEGLKHGKLSVVVGIYVLEVPITALLSYFIIDERITFIQALLVLLIVIGIFSLSVEKFESLKKIQMEKGVWYTVLGTIFMGIANFLFGIGGRITSPFMVNFVTDFVILFFCTIFLFYKQEFKNVTKYILNNSKLILNMTILDNLAWIFYTFSMFLIPISIATGISESCIALSALLGLIINKEKISLHQKTGLALTLTSSIVLALTS